MNTNTTSNNAFVTASIEERVMMDSILNKVGASNIEYSDVKGYDRWDAKFTVKDNGYVTDIKCRKCKHNQYPSTLIEVSKIDYLRKLAKQEGRIPVLLIAFNDGIVYSFNLNNDSIRDIKNSTVACNATTAVLTNKIDKNVILIPFKYGKRIDLNEVKAEQSSN